MSELEEKAWILFELSPSSPDWLVSIACDWLEEQELEEYKIHMFKNRNEIRFENILGDDDRTIYLRDGIDSSMEYKDGYPHGSGSGYGFSNGKGIGIGHNILNPNGMKAEVIPGTDPPMRS